MTTIQVYDPPMCCSTGVCGPDIDPDLVNFAALLSQLGAHGVRVERYNLAQQPMAFAQNLAVKGLLATGGPEVLPIILLNGRVCFQGRYPTSGERPAFIREAMGATEETYS
jgi:hypothetical protein